MRDSKIALLRDAIENTKQIKAVARDLPRVFCPHILGATNGHWYVVVWQFDGYSNSGDLPNWRCFGLDDLSEIEVRAGSWHPGLLSRRRRSTFPINHVDIIANPDHAGLIDAPKKWLHLVQNAFWPASKRLGRLPKTRLSLLPSEAPCD
jgi:hypothetical protein